MNRCRLSYGVSAIAMTLAALAASAAPAAAQEEVSTIEEVVVTATKRAESIMDVPVSISAVSAEQIERLGAKNLEDLARSVPGLVVDPQAEQADKGFIIRGIGSISQSATVAVYVDDTPITFGDQMPDLKLFDVDRIEVLRGPQGTLFGSSAMGGAIRYISPRPGFGGVTGMAKAEVSTIDEGDVSYEFQGAVGGPIKADKLAFRASAFSRHDGGFIDLIDEFTGALRKDDVNIVDSFGGRLALGAQVTDTFDLTLSAVYQQENANYVPTFFSGRGMDFVPPFTTIPLPELSRVDRVPVYRDDQTFLPNLTFNADLGFARLTSSTSYVKRETEIVADFSYFVQTALTFTPALAPFLPIPDTLAVQSIEPREFEAWVQEIRLASTGDGPLQWLVGAYYRTTDEATPQSVPSNLGVVIPPLAGALLPNGSLFERETFLEREQMALFGEASYTFAEKLKFTAGLRLTEMSLKIDRQADGLFNGGFSEIHIKSEESPVTPKFSVQYDVNPDVMVYATAAKGFREGGPNAPVPLGLPACVAALAGLGKTSAPDSFSTDTVWSYELGTKLQTADRRLRFVGAVYNIDWSEIQQSIVLGGGCGFSYIDNIGKARSRGFEAEMSWRPIEPLRIDLNVGYTDAELTEDLITGSDPITGPVILAEEGTRLPNVPDWTVALAGEYQFQPFNDIEAFIRGEVQYLGEAQRLFGDIAPPREGYTVVNMRLGAMRGPYEFNVFVNNIFDEDALLYQSFDTFAPGALLGAGYEAIRVRPRVIGASLKRTF